MTMRLNQKLHDWVLLNYPTVLDCVTREVCRDDVPIDKSREAARDALQEFLCRLVNQKTKLAQRLFIGPDDRLRLKPAGKVKGRRRSKLFTVAYVVKCSKNRASALLVKEADAMKLIEQAWKAQQTTPEPDALWSDVERMGSGTVSADTMRAKEIAHDRRLLLARLRRNLESACKGMPDKERAPLAVGVWKELRKEGHTQCPPRSAFLELIGCTQGDINRWRINTSEETQKTAPSHAKETLRRLLHEREISLRNLVKLSQIFRWYFFAVQ